MPQTLTEESTVAWRVQGTGPDPARFLVIFKKLGAGKVLHATLRPGEVFRRPVWTSADSFETYAVSADPNLRHEFHRKYLSSEQTWTFTLHYKVHFRIGDAARLGLCLSTSDPLERLEGEISNLLGATARRYSWAAMKREGEDFGLRLREAETTDGLGEAKTNFRRLQDFAGTLGFELRHLDVLRSLTEPDLEDETTKRTNLRRGEIARSNHQAEMEEEQRSHERQSQRDQHKIERDTAIARSSQALQGLGRLRLVLDTIARESSIVIGQAASGVHSFPAIQDALREVQEIQQTLTAMSGNAGPALISAAASDAADGASGAGTVQLNGRRPLPLEAVVADACRHLRVLDQNPQDQNRILASVLHLIAEAGLGAEADQEFLTGLQDDLEARLEPVRSALPAETIQFLESILVLDRLRDRLSQP